MWVEHDNDPDEKREQISKTQLDIAQARTLSPDAFEAAMQKVIGNATQTTTIMNRLYQTPLLLTLEQTLEMIRRVDKQCRLSKYYVGKMWVWECNALLDPLHLVSDKDQEAQVLAKVDWDALIKPELYDDTERHPAAQIRKRLDRLRSMTPTDYGVYLDLDVPMTHTRPSNNKTFV